MANEELAPVVERLIAVNSVALVLSGMAALACNNSVGYVEIHKSDILRIAEVLRSYMLTLQVEIEANEQRQAVVQDPRVATAA